MRTLLWITDFIKNVYPQYENYDAINIDKYTEIPYDYDGCMGVPITFLDKYNPKLEEIFGWTVHEVRGYPTNREFIKGIVSYLKTLKD